jgi:TIGR00159 family protein
MAWRDLLDVFSVAVLFYYLYGLVAETRALNLVRGLVVYVLVWFVADKLGLKALAWLLGNAATLGVFALIVVFQPEFRGVLERLGRGRLAQAPLLSQEVEELVRAAERMAARRLGALIAIERCTPLGEYAETGEILDARISARVLETIFTVGTPLHDGGVILRGPRILAAACVFPLSDREDLVYLGTRHRAAVGISEVTDALVIVVSEERGTIRLAERGELSRNLTPSELREKLLGVFGAAA